MSFQRLFCLIAILSIAFFFVAAFLQTVWWEKAKDSFIGSALYILSITISFIMVGSSVLYAMYKLRKDAGLDEKERVHWQNWILFFIPFSAIFYLWTHDHGIQKESVPSRPIFVLFLSLSIFHLCFWALCMTMSILGQSNRWVDPLLMAGNMLLPIISILCLAYLFHMDRRHRFTKGSWGWIVLYFFFPIMGMIMVKRKIFSYEKIGIVHHI